MISWNDEMIKLITQEFYLSTELAKQLSFVVKGWEITWQSNYTTSTTHKAWISIPDHFKQRNSIVKQIKQIDL